MNLLSVEDISKSYGEKVLFKSISFGINKGQKIALIAKFQKRMKRHLHLHPIQHLYLVQNWRRVYLLNFQ